MISQQFDKNSHFENNCIQFFDDVINSPTGPISIKNKSTYNMIDKVVTGLHD